MAGRAVSSLEARRARTWFPLLPSRRFPRGPDQRWTGPLLKHRTEPDGVKRRFHAQDGTDHTRESTACRRDDRAAPHRPRGLRKRRRRRRREQGARLPARAGGGAEAARRALWPGQPAPARGHERLRAPARRPEGPPRGRQQVGLVVRALQDRVPLVPTRARRRRPSWANTRSRTRATPTRGPTSPG